MEEIQDKLHEVLEDLALQNVRGQAHPNQQAIVQAVQLALLLSKPEPVHPTP